MSSEKLPVIALLTDFGTKDGYVAAMKGVILKIFPKVRFVDVTHDVVSFRIESAAYVLKTVFDYFPDASVFLAIVDPGVGTERKGLVVETGNKYLVGPDNGIFSWILDKYPYRAFELKNSKFFQNNVSSTFHGRDIFASVAAYLAQGISVEEFGPEVKPKIEEWVSPRLSPDGCLTRIIHIDKFGNVITNVTDKRLLGYSYVVLNDRRYPLVNTYGDVGEGEVCAIWGSSGHLEISANQKSAANILKLSIGDKLVIKFI